MKITGLPAYIDNYIWIIQSESNNKAWVVDPGESNKVISYFKDNNLSLAGILVTHHHQDHTAGILDILKQLGKAPVISNANGPYKHVTQHVNEGVTLIIADEPFQVLATPGHSHEHISFYNPKALFCGDVLFTAGCGKAWCQSSKVMAESLLKIKELNDDCLIFCGHEYTNDNIRFAAIAEPDNEDIKRRKEIVAFKTDMGIPCVPEKLSVEKKTNPFLRFNTTKLKQTLLKQPQLFENFSVADNGNLYANLRFWKDIFDKTDNN